MKFAPQHNWELFELRCREARTARLQTITDAQAWDIYVSMFEFAASQTGQLSDGQASARRAEKLAIRRRLVAAYSKLDERNRERGAANNSGGCDAVAS